jgi:hypothetical protein
VNLWWQSEVLVGSETVGRPVLIYPDITTDELIPQAKHKTPVVSLENALDRLKQKEKGSLEWSVKSGS